MNGLLWLALLIVLTVPDDPSPRWSERATSHRRMVEAYEAPAMSAEVKR
jgi:hypothetical protein